MSHFPLARIRCPALTAVSRLLPLLPLLLIAPVAHAADLENGVLRVLPARAAEDRRPSDLYLRLERQAQSLLTQRERDYEKIKTAADLSAWQQQQRRIFLEALGEFPERCPLDAKTVGTIAGDGYRVEKVIFQSRPNHHVTANCYVPTASPGPHPAVIVPCGHSFNGKASEAYQRVSILLAKNGIVALCYDPIGQGERYQTFGADGRPLGGNYQGAANSVKQLEVIPGRPLFNPVEEHTLIGIGAILTGTNTAQYRVWDGMRAIDYLVSRNDVDPKRIGCTGNSGGGTLTAYLMALDDRIACAAPTCYLTTFRQLLATSGPQDAEQNLFGQIASGLDESDYVLLRAPRPTLLCAGTRDATFDIAGVWDIFREAKRIYTRAGYSERIDVCEADEPHGFTQPLRVGAVRWMCRWMLGKDEPITEGDLPVHSASELQCTPGGQVMLLPGQRSTFDLNIDRAEAAKSMRQARWTPAQRTATLAEVRQVAVIRTMAELPATRVELKPVTTIKSRSVTPWILHLEDGRQLPGLLFLPREVRGERVLYLHSESKQADVGPGGPIDQLVEAGHIVLALDLEGIGELHQRHPRDWGQNLFGPNVQEFFLAYLLGKSLVAIRAENILAAAHQLSMHGEPKSPVPVRIVAVGDPTGIPALHAAALEPSWIKHLTLKKTVASWTDVVRDPTAARQLQNLVHNALKTYDLPDLERELGDRLTR